MLSQLSYIPMDCALREKVFSSFARRLSNVIFRVRKMFTNAQEAPQATPPEFATR
jgi:hypothetical protein